MKNKYEKLIAESTYHIYNRANGSEKLFRSGENYRYFLEKYKQFISPLADTFCYCLMPNHFHFLIRVKSEAEIAKTLTGLPQSTETLSGFSKLLSQKFSHLFNGYTQAINKQYVRKGGLFMRPFKRIRVDDEQYLLRLVKYIHLNPVEAGICKTPEEWNFSSYSKLIQNDCDFLKQDEIINWFDDTENFKAFHFNSSISYNKIKLEE